MWHTADMKWVAVVVVVVIAVVVAVQLGVFESGAARAYRAHRQHRLEAKGFSKDMVSSRKWSLEIESCEVVGPRAEIRAVQTTATVPPNAASLVFATIITRTIEAELVQEDGRWKVVGEEVVDEQVSTYEDRRNGEPAHRTGSRSEGAAWPRP
jgi:hypothetical protein